MIEDADLYCRAHSQRAGGLLKSECTYCRAEAAKPARPPADRETRVSPHVSEHAQDEGKHEPALAPQEPQSAREWRIDLGPWGTAVVTVQRPRQEIEKAAANFAKLQSEFGTNQLTQLQMEVLLDIRDIAGKILSYVADPRYVVSKGGVLMVDGQPVPVPADFDPNEGREA